MSTNESDGSNKKRPATTNNTITTNDTTDTSRRTKRPRTATTDTTMTTPPPSTNQPDWGDWMGSWKVHSDQIDQEAERIDRQTAAFGGETISRLKDLTVLMVGCQGVGVETAKNLILSNIGGCLVWDPRRCTPAHRGTNCYVTDADVAGGTTTTLAQASIAELKTLNPFCRVDAVSSDVTTIGDDLLLNSNVLNTQKPLAAVVITSLGLLSKADLYRINQTCRTNNIAFVVAANHGITCSLFSDFGPNHEIADATGEPTQTLAVSNVEVLDSKAKLLDISNTKPGDTVIIVTVAEAEQGMDDGDVVKLDDM